MAKPVLKKGNKVLKFDQPGEFYSRRAQKSMNRNDLSEALSFYRYALDKDPHNTDYRISLAHILTEMGLYESSNRILIRLVREKDNLGPHTDCYFGIGCNFMGMMDYEDALDNFKRYLRLDPNGDFTEEAEDMVFLIYEEMEQDGSFLEDGTSEAHQSADDGKRELDMGNYGKAVSLLKHAIELDDSMVYAHNNLALAYFLDEKVDEAKQAARDVLAKHPDNIHALCNLAIFGEVRGGDEEALACFNKVRDCETDIPDEIYKIALTMCEAGDDAAALERFQTALEYRPYDTRTLFCCAAASYNIGEFKQAARYFDRMREADPDDSIGSYYRGVAIDALKGHKPIEHIGYHCQVPMEEVVNRIRYLNECTMNRQDTLGEVWRQDSQFRNYVLWGLKLQDNAIKKAMMELLCLVDDESAEETLRDFIMRRDEPDSIKNDAFALLKRMNAKEPFVAYMNDGLVEARVTVFDREKSFAAPDHYGVVLELCLHRMKLRHKDHLTDSAVTIWSKYVDTFSGLYPHLHTREAWAAALERVAGEAAGETPADFDELAAAYSAEQARIIEHVDDIKQALETHYGDRF